MIAAKIAASSTPAAATSFATFASGRKSGLTRFTISSRTVFRSSSIMTKKMVNVKIDHSKIEKPKKIAAIMVMVAITK